MASGRLIDYLGTGTTGERPVSLDLTVGALGLWWSTDDLELTVWDGTAWESLSSGGGLVSVVAGDGILVDATDPENPEVSVDTAALDFVESIVAGTGVTVDNTDPKNPVVSATGGGGSGDVVGPASAVDNSIVVFDGTTGKLIKDGGETIDSLVALARTSQENVQTGTSYTLVLSDAFKLVAMNNSSANTITVPPNSSVAFPIGTRIDLSQDGTGQTTIVADSGVTIRTPETLKLRKQWAKATLIKRATDTWDLEGNLEAAP